MASSNVTSIDEFAERVENELARLDTLFSAAESEVNNALTTASSNAKIVASRDAFDETLAEINVTIEKLTSDLSLYDAGEKVDKIGLSIDKSFGAWQRRRLACDRAYSKFKEESVKSTPIITASSLRKKLSKSRASSRSATETEIAWKRIEAEQTIQEARLEAEIKISRAQAELKKAEIRSVSRSSRGSSYESARAPPVNTGSAKSGSKNGRNSNNGENGSASKIINAPYQPSVTLGQSYIVLDETPAPQAHGPAKVSVPHSVSKMQSHQSMIYANNPTPSNVLDPQMYHGPAVSFQSPTPTTMGNNPFPATGMTQYYPTSVYQTPQFPHDSYYSRQNTPYAVTPAVTGPYTGHSPGFPANYNSRDPLTDVMGTVKRGFDLQMIKIDEFSGNPLDFHRYMNDFDSVMEPYGVDPANHHPPAVKLNILLKTCIGNARIALDSCRHAVQNEATYKSARQILYDNYGRPSYVVAAFIKEMTGDKPVDTSDLNALISASDKLQSASRVLTQCGATSQVDAPVVLHSIMRRFSIGFLLRYLAHSKDLIFSGKEPCFKHFVDFVKGEAAIARSPLAQFVNELRQEKGSRNRRTDIKLYNTDVSPAVSTQKTGFTQDRMSPTHKPSQQCLFCDGGHQLYKCEDFKKKNPAERKQFVVTKSLCFNCLKSGHDFRSCPSTHRCKVEGCTKSHHTLLHGAPVKTTTHKTEPATTEASTACSDGF